MLSFSSESKLKHYILYLHFEMESVERTKLSKEKLKVHPKEKACFLSDFFFW
jgi:hypothetical protein